MKLLLILVTALFLNTSFAQNITPKKETKTTIKKSEQTKKVILARRNTLTYITLKGQLDDTDYWFVNEDIARNLNRLKVINDPDEEEDLSDYVRWRLFLARQLALLSINKAYI